MAEPGYLLDVNTVFALMEEEHVHHGPAMRWFESTRPQKWGLCSLTENGFLRLACNPKVGAHTVEEAIAVLDELTAYPGFCFWPIADRWITLTMPFAGRVFGHQQITDACLLGLAVKEKAVLVTFDKAVGFMAGTEFSEHVLLLE